MIFYDILLLNLDDYKMFREAAFFELENLMRSEIKIDSKREALDIMYQPHENEIYGADDDNFFLYFDDKSGYLFPITLVGSTTNSNNNSSSNLNLQCEKLNASIMKLIQIIFITKTKLIILISTTTITIISIISIMILTIII